MSKKIALLAFNDKEQIDHRIITVYTVTNVYLCKHRLNLYFFDPVNAKQIIIFFIPLLNVRRFIAPT